MAQKFSDKQLLSFIQAGFSAEEISLFGENPAYAPTDDELEALIATNDITQAVDTIPDNLPEFFAEIEKTYGVLMNEKLSKAEFESKVSELAKQNPTLAKQVATLILLLDYAEN